MLPIIAALISPRTILQVLWRPVTGFSVQRCYKPWSFALVISTVSPKLSVSGTCMRPEQRPFVSQT